MAIKRSVVITCDGPCGTVVNAETVPQEWNYLKLQKVHTPSGEKPNYQVAALCGICSGTVWRLLAQRGFAFNEVNPPQVKPTLQPTGGANHAAAHAEVCAKKTCGRG